MIAYLTKTRRSLRAMGRVVRGGVGLAGWLAVVAGLAGCQRDPSTSVGVSDLSHGPRDLSALFPDEDLAMGPPPPDLEPPPEPYRCPPLCDGGTCQVRCRAGGKPLPDLVIPGVLAEWMDVGKPGVGLRFTACVVNQGEADAPAGTPITFRWNGEKDPLFEVLATVRLTSPLAAGEGAEVTYFWWSPSGAEGSCVAWAVAGDDGSYPPRIPPDGECNVDNNQSPAVDPHLCGPG